MEYVQRGSLHEVSDRTEHTPSGQRYCEIKLFEYSIEYFVYIFGVIIVIETLSDLLF